MMRYLRHYQIIERTQNRTDYLFDVNYTVSSQSNTIIIIYISASKLTGISNKTLSRIKAESEKVVLAPRRDEA